MKEKKDLKYRCYNLSLEVVRFLNTLELKRINYVIIEQLMKSITSTGANVVEGRSGSSKKDLIKFYQIALKSANESKYWVCLIRDAFDIDKIKMNGFLDELDEISKVLGASIITLKKQNDITFKI